MRREEPAEPGTAASLFRLPQPRVSHTHGFFRALQHLPCFIPALSTWTLSSVPSPPPRALQTQHSPYILASAHSVPMLAEVLLGLAMDWQVVQVLK